jgi:hypothetical protein
VQSWAKCAFVAACTVSFGIVPLGAAPAMASPSSTACAGDTETFSWAPPADTAGLTGFLVQDTLSNDGTDGSHAYEATVPLTETSTTVPVLVGYNNYAVYASTSASLTGTLIGTSTWDGGVTPKAATWSQDPAINSVGDGTATVSFAWNGPITGGTAGYLPDSAQVTASSGASTTLPNFDGLATVTFTGLTDGQAYTFTSDTSNACGGTVAPASPTFVPGVAPVWKADSPRLTAPSGLYSARFRATGAPAPTYELTGAPSWLSIVPSGHLGGLVYGVAPAGTTSFSYSVTAGNGVGVQTFPTTDISAGPFTVTTMTRTAHLRS